MSQLDIASIIVTSVTADGTIDANTLGAIAARISRLEPLEVTALGLDPGLVARIRESYSRNECSKLPNLITKQIASIWAAVGTADECAESIQRQLERGVTLPILFTFGCEPGDLLELGRRVMSTTN